MKRKILFCFLCVMMVSVINVNGKISLNKRVKEGQIWEKWMVCENPFHEDSVVDSYKITGAKNGWVEYNSLTYKTLFESRKIHDFFNQINRNTGCIYEIKIIKGE